MAESSSCCEIRPSAGDVHGRGRIGKDAARPRGGRELTDQFESHVFFVALAAVSDRHDGGRDRRIVGIRETGGQPFHDLVKDHLRRRAIAGPLLLDNLEQVLAASDLVVELIEAAGC